MRSSYLITTVKVAALFGVLTLNACAIEKVGVTDRGNLAKSVMIRDVSDQALALELHSYVSKENTTGGYGVGGGGCGCN